MQTTVNSRLRTEIKICQGSTSEAAESEYANYEGLKAADTSKTWTVRAVGAYFQPATGEIPSSFIILAEGSYPEYTTDGTQVP